MRKKKNKGQKIDPAPYAGLLKETEGFIQRFPWTHLLPAIPDRKQDARLFAQGTSRLWNWLRSLGFELQQRYDMRGFYDYHGYQELSRRNFMTGEPFTQYKDSGVVTAERKITTRALKTHFRRNFKAPRKRDMTFFKASPDRAIQKFLKAGNEETLLLMPGTIGCPAAEESNVILFDLDDHSNTGIVSEKAQNSLRVFCALFGEPLLLEVSHISGSCHVYFRLNMTIDREQLQTLSALLRGALAGGADFELRTQTKLMSLPGSITYELVRISNFDTFLAGAPLIGSPYRNLVHAIEETNRKGRPVASCEKVMEALRSMTPEPVAEPSMQKVEKLSAGRLNQVGTGSKDFTIEDGSRNDQMWRLACSAARRGLTDEQLALEIRENSAESTTLATWSDEQLLRRAAYELDRAKKFIKSTSTAPDQTTAGFHSSSHLLTERHTGIIKDLAREVHRLYLQARNFKRKKAGQKYQKQIENLLLEMCGRMIYEANHPRQADPSAPISDLEKSEYSTGFTFPIKGFLEGLAKQYKMKGRIEPLFNSVIDVCFFLTEYRTSLKGYRYGSYAHARQYVFTFQDKGLEFANQLLEAISLALETTRRAKTPAHLRLLKRGEVRREIKNAFLEKYAGQAVTHQTLIIYSIQYYSRVHGFSPQLVFDSLGGSKKRFEDALKYVEYFGRVHARRERSIPEALIGNIRNIGNG